MIEMTVYCGTRTPIEFKIDVDSYAEAVPTNVDKAAWRKAVDLLKCTMFDDTFADDGCRNEDAVDSCIALHVLGFDPEIWFENFFNANNKDGKFFETDISKFMEHVERVNHYVSKWGPEGNEGAALDYAIN